MNPSKLEELKSQTKLTVLAFHNFHLKTESDGSCLISFKGKKTKQRPLSGLDLKLNEDIWSTKQGIGSQCIVTS